MAIGDMILFLGEAPPDGWLFADGRAISRDLYPELFRRIDTRFGMGDGQTTFNLPDSREGMRGGVAQAIVCVEETTS